jgi:hypothetical protein
MSVLSTPRPLDVVERLMVCRRRDNLVEAHHIVLVCALRLEYLNLCGCVLLEDVYLYDMLLGVWVHEYL